MYINDLNKKPNKKSKIDSPEIKDKKVNTASMLMIPRPYPKACSKHIMDDPRLKKVKKYEQAGEQVSKHLSKVSAIFKTLKLFIRHLYNSPTFRVRFINKWDSLSTFIYIKCSFNFITSQTSR